MAESPEEHLLNHLRDAHAVELQAVRQLERAAKRRDEETREVYAEHLEETRGHEQRMRELVEAHGHDPTPIEDKTLRGGAIGLRQLADVALDTPVKMAMNLFALEHLEIATYELLAEIAKAAEDEDAAKAAEEILPEEREAVEKLTGTFDRAVELHMEKSEQDDVLLAHLRDIHAMEQQSMQLFQTAVDQVGEDDELERLYKEHLEQTEDHERLIAERIEARDAKPSAVKDLHAGAAKSGLIALADGPPDVCPKLAMNLFCLESLEVAGYELLIRIADRCDDSETVDVAEKILGEEREAAEAIQNSFPHTVELMFESDAAYATASSAARSDADDD
ncbi:MAG: DUF892 family protein [Solirubrobacteraceae bacterium]